jgi:hypothetical protein
MLSLRPPARAKDDGPVIRGPSHASKTERFVPGNRLFRSATGTIERTSVPSKSRSEPYQPSDFHGAADERVFVREGFDGGKRCAVERHDQLMP